MPEATIQVTLLEGIDLGTTPPCNALSAHDSKACLVPSVVRITASCCYQRRLFLCQFHYDELKTGNIQCGRCGAHGDDFNWVVT